MTERESPEQIRQEIEQVRGELGSTVEELAERTNVSARMREKRATIATRVRDSTPAPVLRAAAVIHRHPAPFALGGGIATGFVIARVTGDPVGRLRLRRTPPTPQFSGRLAKVAEITAFMLSGTADALNGTAEALGRRVPARKRR
jgi:Protein of unknown function (DUF3618)